MCVCVTYQYIYNYINNNVYIYSRYLDMWTSHDISQELCISPGSKPRRRSFLAMLRPCRRNNVCMEYDEGPLLVVLLLYSCWNGRMDWMDYWIIGPRIPYKSYKTSYDSMTWDEHPYKFTSIYSTKLYTLFWGEHGKMFWPPICIPVQYKWGYNYHKLR